MTNRVEIDFSDCITISSENSGNAVAVAFPKDSPLSGSTFNVPALTKSCVEQTMLENDKFSVKVPDRIVEALTDSDPIDIILLTFKQKIGEQTKIYRPDPIGINPVSSANQERDILAIASSVIDRVVYYISKEDSSSDETWSVDIEFAKKSRNKFGLMPL